MLVKSRTLLVILNFIVSINHVAGRCKEDVEEAIVSEQKQQVHLVINWLGANNRLADDNSSKLQVENIRMKLDSALVGDLVKYNLTMLEGQYWLNQSNLIKFELFPTEIILSTSVTPSKDFLLSGDLLKTLNNLVDCDKQLGNGKCQSAMNNKSDLVYELWPSPVMMSNLLDDSSQTSPYPIGKIKLRINGTSDGESGCQLCQQIVEESRGGARKDFINMILTSLVSAVNKLDPHHWLAIVVGIWLTTCFVIAMIIQRRDKRRMRLYLRERANDYSFSAKRQAPQKDYLDERV